jgi:O-antigen/teichoic acid export membrane protein
LNSTINNKTVIKKDFAKNVLLLISGTSIAQAIAVAVSPILTRIYSPENFGVFGIYVAICSLLAVFATARYDLSIIEPRFDNDAKLLLIISLIIAGFFSLFLMLIVILFNHRISLLFDSPDIGKFLYIVPVSVFILSTYNVIMIWLNRKKKFKDMSQNRIINSSSTSVITLSFGLIKFTTGGLIIGYLLGQIFAIIFILKKIFSEKFSFDRKKSIVLMRRYSRYPKFLIPSTLAGELSTNSVTILFTTLFSATVAGFFTFTNRVIALPISLIGNAIGEVYRQKAGEEYHINGNCKALYLKTLKRLFFVGLIPFLVLFFFGEVLFGLVFGSEWIIAGKIAKYFSFIVFFQFLSTPLSYTIVYNQSQNLDLILQIFRAVLSILALFLGYIFSSYMLSIILYTIVFSLYYISHSVIQYRAALGKTKT